MNNVTLQIEEIMQKYSIMHWVLVISLSEFLKTCNISNDSN